MKKGHDTSTTLFIFSGLGMLFVLVLFALTLSIISLIQSGSRVPVAQNNSPKMMEEENSTFTSGQLQNLEDVNANLAFDMTESNFATSLKNNGKAILPIKIKTDDLSEGVSANVQGKFPTAVVAQLHVLANKVSSSQGGSSSRGIIDINGVGVRSGQLLARDGEQIRECPHNIEMSYDCFEFDIILHNQTPNNFDSNKEWIIADVDLSINKEAFEEIQPTSLIFALDLPTSSLPRYGSEYASKIMFEGEQGQETPYLFDKRMIEEESMELSYSDIVDQEEPASELTFEQQIGLENICAGDINQLRGALLDSAVDSVDAQILVSYLNSQSMPNYEGELYQHNPQENVSLDFNGDGEINITDLAILAQNYGQTDCQLTLAEARS